MDHGLRDLINEADSLGNTPLHVLIARYALEERKLAHSNSKSYGYHDDHQVNLIFVKYAIVLTIMFNISLN